MDLSLLHDASYVQCIELGGPFSELIHVFESISLVGDSPVDERFVCGREYGRCLVYAGTDNRLVAPIQYLWHSVVEASESRIVWCWVHCAAAPECLSVFREAASRFSCIQVGLRHDLVRLEFYGPRSVPLIRHVLDIRDDCAACDSPSLLSLLDNKEAMVAHTTAVHLSVADPRFSFPRKGPAPQVRAGATAGIVPSSTTRISSPLFDSYQHWRGEYCGKLLEDRIKDAIINEYRRTSRNCLNPGSVETPRVATIPVLLLYRPAATGEASTRATGFGSGCDLVLPAGWAVDFWKTFVFAGARVGGLRERRMIDFECGRASFPSDFLECASGVELRHQLGTTMKAACEARPPAKRTNYERARITSPFFVDVDACERSLAFLAAELQPSPDTLSSLPNRLTLRGLTQPSSLLKTFTRIRLLMIGRGVPHVNAQVFVFPNATLQAYMQLEQKKRQLYRVDYCSYNIGGVIY